MKIVTIIDYYLSTLAQTLRSGTLLTKTAYEVCSFIASVGAKRLAENGVFYVHLYRSLTVLLIL